MVPVRLYTTTYCGFCVAAKRLLTRKGIPFEEIDLTGNDDERAWLIQASGGRRTVPQIWIGERHVGGYAELASLDRSGDLDRLAHAGSGRPALGSDPADHTEEPS